MTAGDLLLRPAVAGDIETIQAIYAHHVTTGLASFEEVPPDIDEIRRRWRAIADLGLPYIVAVADGRIAGYAYAGPYRPRTAYRFTVEDSIYLDPAFRGRGIGRSLLSALIEESTRLGKRQMIAVIGDSANTASIALHRGLGFADAGVFRAVGFKFGRWVDSVLMQRPLGPGDAALPE